MSARYARRLRPALGALLLLVAVACDPRRALWEPDPEALSRSAPDSFVVAVETSVGSVEITFHRAWSPLAVDRALFLMSHGFFDGARFYRVTDQYAQFGFSGVPALDSIWRPITVPDEEVRASNMRGAVSFARSGPESRSHVLFINLGDNSFLDTWAGDGVRGFPPVGRVNSGIEVVDRLHSGYGDDVLFDEDSIRATGNAFLDRRYPGLDSIVSTRVVRRW